MMQFRAILIVLSAVAISECSYRFEERECERLGKKPTDELPAQACWFYCYDEELNRIYEVVETFGAACQEQKNLPPGVCFGTWCKQSRYGRTQPTQGPTTSSENVTTPVPAGAISEKPATIPSSSVGSTISPATSGKTKPHGLPTPPSVPPTLNIGYVNLTVASPTAPVSNGGNTTKRS